MITQIVVGFILVWASLVFVVPSNLTLPRWRTALRVFGWRGAARGALRMASLRYRQPFRDIRLTAPGPSTVAFGGLAAVCFVNRSGAIVDLWLAGGLIATWVAITLPLTTLVPPTVLFMGISDYDQFRAMKKMQRLDGLMVLSLINQASVGVLKNYRQHYAAVSESIRAQQTGIRRLRTAAIDLLPRDPTAPRFDSLRTRPSRWRETLRDAIGLSPILVIDARDESRYVLEEALWICATGSLTKCLFLVRDDGSAPILRHLCSLGVSYDQAGAKMVTWDELEPSLLERARTLEATSLPTADVTSQDLATAVESLRKFASMVSSLAQFEARVSEKNGADPALDADILAWERTQPREILNSDIPRYTQSIDAALALTMRHLPVDGAKCSHTIEISIDGLANVSIGLQSRPGNMRIFASDQFRLEPPRAILQAFFRTLLA